MTNQPEKQKYTFIRGLWGEAADSEYPTHTLPATLYEIDKSLQKTHQPQPTTVYCWGDANFAFLQSRGANTVLASHEPIANYSGNPKTPRGEIDSMGRINFGLSMWRHKLESFRLALQQYEHVIWLDWDVHQIRPLPTDFWSTLAKGQPIQAVLRQYRRPQCPWRLLGKRIVVHGAFVYCRSLLLIERTIDVHAQHFSYYTDETAISFVIDELLGGWPGINEYRNAGFSPSCYDQRKKYVHPDPMYQHPDPVFRNMGRY